MKREYLLGIYEKALPDTLSLEENLYIAKNYGFDFIEICFDDNENRMRRLQWSDGKISRLVTVAKQLNLTFETVSLSYLRKMPLGILDEELNKKSLELIKDTLSFTKKIGAKIVLINGYDVFNEPSSTETQDRFVENLRKVGKLAEAYGVSIGIENAEMEMTDSITKAKHWVDKVKSPYVKIYGDIGNSTNAFNGEIDKVIKDIQVGGKDILAIHLKDNRYNEYRHVPFGEGRVDFNLCIDTCKAQGVQIYVAELFETETWEDELKYTHKFLKEKLNK